MRKNLQYIIFLLIILAIAAFFRLWQLNSIPPGLYPDVAMNGNDALGSLKTGNFKLFYPENNGREGLMIWLIAFSFSIFGVSIWSIKIAAALIGILTVLGLYLLTKELLTLATSDKRQATSIALLSSFFLAISFWHVNFSRIGFRAILVPFCLVFLFYFLFQGFRTKKVSNFIFSGLFFGLGFYTYIAFRLAVPLVLLILIPWWLIYKKKNLKKVFILYTLYFILTTFIVALPIGIYFLNHPQDFISRAGDVSVFSQKNPILALGKSLASHLLMFNFLGDFNWRHNISGKPVLFWPVGILFLIGLIFCLGKILKAFKNENRSSVIGYWSLISWWFVMLLPGVLTSEGVPHSLRVIGSIPPTFIFAGIGGLFLWEKINQFQINKKTRGWLIPSLLILLAVLFIYAQYWRYFILWGKNPETEGAFSKNYVLIGNYLNSLPKTVKKYVIVNQSGTLVKGIPMPAQTAMFIESTKFGEPQSIYLLPEDIDKIKIIEEGVIVPMLSDIELLNELSRKFPNGEIIEKEGFWVYEINFQFSIFNFQSIFNFKIFN
jgi:4-amino-4-deoxy-L-arabinose transferase-like glycosyltransferase